MIHKFFIHSDSVFGVISLGNFIFSASRDSRIGISKISSKTFESFIALNPFNLDSQSSKHNLVAYGSFEKVCIWDMINPNNEIVIGSHKHQVYITCFSFSQEFLISGSIGKKDNLIIWDLKSRNMRSSLIGHNESVVCLDISADDLNAISGDNLGKILYWNLINFRQEYVFEGHTDIVKSVKFARNKKYAASGGIDMKVIVWDIENKIIYAIFNGHADYIYKVMFTNDDENVVSGDFRDGTRVWNIANRSQIFLFNELKDPNEWLNNNKGIKAEFSRFLI